MTESRDRLEEAAREVALRVVLAERNFQRVLARQQQAEAATLRVRRLRDRARGDLRLIAALLEEKETFFEEEGGEAQTEVQQDNTPPYLYSMVGGASRADAEPSPDSPPGSSPSTRCLRRAR